MQKIGKEGSNQTLAASRTKVRSSVFARPHVPVAPRSAVRKTPNNAEGHICMGHGGPTESTVFVHHILTRGFCPAAAVCDQRGECRVRAQRAHFANDMALDAEGNLYVTASFAPVIYRISQNGTASVFAENPLFQDGEGFNLNGIAWVDEGYLLVVKYNSGTIFRVSTADPADVITVQVSEALVGIRPASVDWLGKTS